MLRHNEAHVDQKVIVTGEVVQVNGDPGNFMLMVDVPSSDRYALNYVWVWWPSNDRFLEGDQVDVYGELSGLKTYTTVLGAEKTVPEVNAAYIDLN
jgi:hypothetical protein